MINVSCCLKPLMSHYEHIMEFSASYVSRDHKQEQG